MGISGNLDATIRLKLSAKVNEIGEKIHEWIDIVKLRGWLDLAGGDSQYSNYNAKIQESTHVFLCDFHSGEQLHEDWKWNPYTVNTGISDAEGKEILLTSEMCHMTIAGVTYDIKIVDDPMNMHRQLEFYLKFVGGAAVGKS